LLLVEATTSLSGDVPCFDESNHTHN